MTDTTRDHDRPFAGGGKPDKTTSDGPPGGSQSFGRADRTPAGTAEPARLAGERTTRDRPDRSNRRDGGDVEPHTARAESDGASLTGESRVRADGSDDGPGVGASADSTAPPDQGPGADRIEERLRAVERALTGTDDAVADIGDEAAASAEREALSTRIDDLEARVEELEAATQAIRGYVGSIRSVNQAVERRADLALARASTDGGGTATGERTADRDATEAGALDDDVPSEAALDAAVPTERSGENGTGAAAESAVDRPGTRGGDADDSWRAGALDRLRESL
ncbi:DUF7310 family coiled-coil domain-containing protein [Halorubrum kocurii]|uniref:DUF7310 domain-containing protein n=1 Tax=Halorubrum kocurii JCM 14978 TaxID=1230456 RepID=M0NYY0_9EURY|nr:hypothetical protein [Halorubrum kocurii]EMA62793.1 hypothetical protein C468_10397 [Halorubrum kocurii JCM 14978]